MAGRVERICELCGSIGFTKSHDGFFYCNYCQSQADDVIDTGVDEEQFFNTYSASCNRSRTANPIVAEPISQVKLTTSQYLDHPDISADDKVDIVGDGVGPTEPSDFGSSQKKYTCVDFSSEIRSRYLSGLQYMIQLQCQALVEKFNVSPLIIGIVGPLWLRFVASTRITDDGWVHLTLNDSEAQTQEVVGNDGKRAVSAWYKSLKSKIPISCSLAISFLGCHVAREAITPADMLNWTLEGKLPYFASFGEIEKQIGPLSDLCPIPVSRMFRPIQAISSQKLESMAAGVATKIHLQLPPVNFYAIASRFLRQLSLPIGKLLPLACRVCEWSTPPELYLSANDLRIPTRVCVMAILIVTIRVLYGINGYGMWESSLSKNEHTGSLSHVNTTENVDEDFSSNNLEPSDSKSDVLDSRLNVMELLQILEAKYSELDDTHAYSSNLLSYLQYCKDVVFSGLRPSYEDVEEEKLLEDFWDFYQNNNAVETVETSGNQGMDSSGSIGWKNNGSRQGKKDENETRDDQSTCNAPRSSDTSNHGIHSSKYSTDHDDYSYRDQESATENRPSKESTKDKAIKRLKLDMEDNKFCYIPPRIKVKRRDYLHYARRREDVYIYAVHADYYILLRSCAKVAQVETRIMHIAVLTLERRLQWLEKRVDSSLHTKFNLNDACGFCNNDSVQDAGDDPMDLST